MDISTLGTIFAMSTLCIGSFLIFLAAFEAFSEKKIDVFKTLSNITSKMMKFLVRHWTNLLLYLPAIIVGYLILINGGHFICGADSGSPMHHSEGFIIIFAIVSFGLAVLDTFGVYVDCKKHMLNMIGSWIWGMTSNKLKECLVFNEIENVKKVRILDTMSGSKIISHKIITPYVTHGWSDSLPKELEAIGREKPNVLRDSRGDLVF